MAEKFLPADMAEGIERFILHLCKSEALRDQEATDPIALADYRRSYDIEIKRATAHIWETGRGAGRSSVAWIIIADESIRHAKPHSDAHCRCSDCLREQAFFKRGDILKSATWKAPAKNFARGNVLTDTAFPRWHWNGWI